MIRNTFSFNSQWTFAGEDTETGVAEWSNAYGDVLSVNFFSQTPDIEANPDDIHALRAFYRTMAAAHGLAPLAIERTDLNGLRAIQTIYKVRMETRGFAYLGSFTLPFADRSYVIKIQAIEAGVTGMREAAVMLVEGNTEADIETGKILGWESDPYDPDYKAEFMANKADHPKYDLQFPEHPLSRVRSALTEIKNDSSCDPSLHRLRRFSFDPPSPIKS